MTEKELLSERFNNQQLGETKFKKPEEITTWFGAMQGQDFEHAKWAIGSRLPNLRVSAVEQAIKQRKIIRTWLLRGTLHIVSAQDIHWILDLLAPRILAANASRYRQLELDEKTLKKSNAILVRALQQEPELRREGIAGLLRQAGIATHDQRLVHLLQHAALKKIICFGSKQGAQFTFTLLDKGIPAGNTLSRTESLAMLAVRYFQSHGPATLPDFVWWSGLNKTEAAKAIAAAGRDLSAEKIKETLFWRSSHNHSGVIRNQKIFFLPAFDELIIGYKDRSLSLLKEQAPEVISKNGIFYPIIMGEGKALGTWKRSIKREQVFIEPHYFRKPAMGKEKEIIAASQMFGAFIGREVLLSGVSEK